jgi:hypothetical protein
MGRDAGAFHHLLLLAVTLAPCALTTSFIFIFILVRPSVNLSIMLLCCKRFVCTSFVYGPLLLAFLTFDALTNHLHLLFAGSLSSAKRRSLQANGFTIVTTPVLFGTHLSGNLALCISLLLLLSGQHGDTECA